MDDLLDTAEDQMGETGPQGDLQELDKEWDNDEIKEEAEQINSIPKTIEDCKENVSNE